VHDVKAMHAFIQEHARAQQMLPRALNELYEHVRDFFLYEEDGALKGLCALHVLWEDLAEVRSLAVRADVRRQGVGRALLRRCLREARQLGVRRVFALTYQPQFFLRMGFREVEKGELPQKIWGDCVRCPKFPQCDEVAVIKEVL